MCQNNPLSFQLHRFNPAPRKAAAARIGAATPTATPKAAANAEAEPPNAITLFTLDKSEFER